VLIITQVQGGIRLLYTDRDVHLQACTETCRQSETGAERDFQ
jgi:hypothetical protein